VDARDVPAFVANQGQKPAEMRQVRFPLRDRVEMAAAWAFPISVFAALVLLFFWPAAILPLVLLVWGISLLLYTTFPSYERWLHVKRRAPRDAGLEFGRGGIQLALWGPCLLALIALAVWSDPFGWADALRWGAATLAIVLVVTIDLSGSTPVLKSGLYPDRLLEVSLDRESCIACGACERVCPRNCFQIDPLVHAAAMPGSARCVQCGACIVQCPADALRFHGPGGEVVPPEVVRKYKLNLMGSRKHDPFRK